MSETDIESADPAPAEALHDADDRLKSSFVDAVIACVEEGDAEGARALVRPLHPADIADLFELAPQDMRQPIAAAIAQKTTGQANERDSTGGRTIQSPNAARNIAIQAAYFGVTARRKSSGDAVRLLKAGSRSEVLRSAVCPEAVGYRCGSSKGAR